MIHKAKLTRVAAAVALSVGLASSAVAQETSSAIRGVILSPAGAPAANTKITIIHEASGTTRTFTTNDAGTFQSKGLRVGGPYTIIIDSDQYRDQRLENVFLSLGETERLNITLQADNVEKITVTGAAVNMASSNRNYFGEDAIKTAASLTRDIKDVVRSNPLVSIMPGDDAPMTIAGSNPKYNSITVDGIGQNDDFGLNGGGYPTQRSPLPFDALEQVTVDVTPFDAKVSGFSGGLVNAVFKSGTNDLSGGVFWEKTSDSWAGTPTTNGREVPVEFEEKTYGMNLGGAFIEDTLFFFTSYEKYESPQTLEWGAAGSGAANETDATLEEYEAVRQIAQDVYGLTDEQIGLPTGSPVEEDEKWVAKIDWNINNDHRAAFTYQYNKGNRTRNTTSSASELRLSSQWYNVSETLKNFTAKLYSDWSDNFSTEASYTRKDVSNRQVSFGDIADVTVDNLPSGGQIAFGSDEFRHANLLDNVKTTIKLDAEYLMDEHTLSFGGQYEDLDILNLFVPASKGVIYFDGLEDFENRIADYRYENGSGNDPTNAGAEFSMQQLSLYAQDTWDGMDDWTFTFGVRYERLMSDDKPAYNANSFARTGYDNTENLDGLDIWLPRFAFSHYVNEDLTVRGGIGKFAGGQPNVWISNAYSKNGALSGKYDEQGVTLDANSIAGIYGPAFDVVQNAVSDGEVAFNDPNFKIPHDWRYQLAADYVFDIPGVAEGVEWTTEALFIDRKDAAFWIDASLHDAEIDYAADGERIIYTDNDKNRDLMLTNSRKGGQSKILSTSLAANWDNGISVTASYAHQDITEVNPGTSSTEQSNYRYSDGINRNIPSDHYGRAGFEVKHRFVVNFGYNTELFSGYETNINLFYARRSGNPVTYSTAFRSSVLTSDVGDTVVGLSPEFTAGDYTSYIPTLGDNNVVYTNADLEAALMANIDAYGLTGYQGGYAPKGTGTTPWVTTLDLSIRQEVPGFMEGHKGTVYLTVDNLLNLLDSAAGKVYDNSFGTSRLYQVREINDDGQYVIDRVYNDSNRFQAEQSTWRLKIGVRYDF